MNAKEHQDGEVEKTHVPHDLADCTKSVDESRRGFTKSGLAASGVLLTLASRPVLACVCKSPSGFLSGNVSTHGTPQTCSGRTPGYWGTHPQQWPSPFLPGDCKHGTSGTHVSDWSGGTRFSTEFNCSGNGSIYVAYQEEHKDSKRSKTTYQSSVYSMMQVIWLGGGGDPYQLGAHIVAALLNAVKGLTPTLTEAQVINIFNEWNLHGYFEPTAGVKWYEADIVDYLKSTMPL
ncbi:MAG: hypothetical protein ABFE02_08170 [Sulfuricella sp.]